MYIVAKQSAGWVGAATDVHLPSEGALEPLWSMASFVLWREFARYPGGYWRGIHIPEAEPI